MLLWTNAVFPRVLGMDMEQGRGFNSPSAPVAPRVAWMTTQGPWLKDFGPARCFAPCGLTLDLLTPPQAKHP